MDEVKEENNIKIEEEDVSPPDDSFMFSPEEEEEGRIIDSHEENRMESQPQQAVSSNNTLVLVGQRASPINSLECEHLTKLVQNEIILDNESTDGKIMAMKKLAWERVTLHLNAAGYCEKRTVYQLQKVWECIKANGAAPPPIPEASANKVLTIPGTETDDLDCDFDSDAVRSVQRKEAVHPVTLYKEITPQEEEVLHVGTPVSGCTTSKSLEMPISLSKSQLTNTPVLREPSTSQHNVSKRPEDAAKITYEY
ncbi:hypothetical protein O3P69_015140 [Scylla paramamosain]|uniref:Regulatory protein zeste n=1 Tax=Scylla paramamosain TaxID=85552 RepID=A0AAW0T2Q7_SCYPA